MIGVYMNKLAVLYSLMQTQKFWHLMHWKCHSVIERNLNEIYIVKRLSEKR